MKLSDIRTGHVVEFRNGERMVAMLDNIKGQDTFVNEIGFMRLMSYDEDMLLSEHDHRSHGDEDYDIVKVFRGEWIKDMFNPSTLSNKELIWDRYATLDLEEGDVLISRELHSCKVKFVEEVNEDCILLVDGLKDESYEKEEFYLIAQQYEILCKAKDRKDV